MRVNTKPVSTTLLIALFLLGATASMAQDAKTQAQLASKTAKIGSIAKTDASVASAIDAHELDKASAMVGKAGSFKGTVVRLFAPNSGTILILNFDRDYKTALTAVVKRANFDKFPDLALLEGKQVVISGKFSEFRDAPQMELTSPEQIKIVE